MRTLAVVALVLAAGCVTPGAVKPTSVDAAGATDASFSSTSVFPGTYRVGDKVSHVVTNGMLSMLKPELVQFRSKLDGADLQLAVMRPDVPAGTKVPVIALGSPYFFDGVTPDVISKSAYYARLVENFVPLGYAVAFIPVRGTADAGSCFDLMGKLEHNDLDQAITYLGEQSWSNGNVGMVGLSYDGSTPWEAAAMSNPHLKTIVPISGVNDPYQLMYNGGVPEWRGLMVLNGIYYAYGFQQYNPTTGRSAQHTLEGAVCPDAWQGLAAADFSYFTGSRDPTGWWAERNSRPRVEATYNGSIFVVHGLQDWNVDLHQDFPWVTKLSDAGVPMKFLLGQWDHAYPDSHGSDITKASVRWDWAEILRHWFDRWLKDDKTTDLGPRVQVQDSQHKWRNEKDWPPKDANLTMLYLGADGKLSSAPGQKGAVTVTTRGDPSLGLGDLGLPVSAPCVSTCATFTSAPYAEGLRFAGLAHFTANVTPTQPAGQVSAWLYATNGSKTERVAWGAVDVRYPKGGESMQMTKPGDRIEIDITFEAADARVSPGEKLVLVLHTDGYSDHPGLEPGPTQVEVGNAALTLPVIVRNDATAFFTPPS